MVIYSLHKDRAITLGYVFKRVEKSAVKRDVEPTELDLKLVNNHLHVEK
jgi:hypothetical protein